MQAIKPISVDVQRPITRGVVELYLVVGGDCKQHVCCRECLKTRQQANSAVIVTRVGGSQSNLWCDICGKDVGES